MTRRVACTADRPWAALSAEVAVAVEEFAPHLEMKRRPDVEFVAAALAPAMQRRWALSRDEWDALLGRAGVARVASRVAGERRDAPLSEGALGLDAMRLELRFEFEPCARLPGRFSLLSYSVGCGTLAE